MNKNILMIALATGLLALPAASFADPPGAWFVSAQLGQSHLQGMSASNDSGTGGVFSAGYRWMVNPAFEIGPEVGYVTLGSYSDKFYVALPGEVTAKVKGAFAGANARFFFSPNWYAQLQTGYFNAHNTIGTHYGTSYTVDKPTDSSWYTGIGFGYRFSNNASLGFVFNHFDDTTRDYDLGSSLASVRVEYQF